MPGNAFVYGTLMADEVLHLLIKRVPTAKPATLNGYIRHRVKGQVFPAIVPAAKESKVHGQVGLGLHCTRFRKLFLFVCWKACRPCTPPHPSTLMASMEVRSAR